MKGCMIMEKLDKVELVREKCGVSYEEARDALEACNYDVLDAIVKLEREGKANVRTATFTTEAESTPNVSAEMAQAQYEYHEQSRKTKVGETLGRIGEAIKKALKAGMDMTFVAEREGERVVALPLLIVIIGLLAWGASLWLLIIGLFFGFRYHIEGADPLTIDVNDAMGKAADVADGIRRDITNEDGSK